MKKESSEREPWNHEFVTPTTIGEHLANISDGLQIKLMSFLIDLMLQC